MLSPSLARCQPGAGAPGNSALLALAAFLILLLTPPVETARAQSEAESTAEETATDPEDAPSPSSETTRRGRWALFPILFSSSETGWGFGVLPLRLFTLSPHSRPSSIRIDAYCTQNGQLHLQVTPRFWMRGDVYRLGGKVAFKEWPTSFYGIGSATTRDDEEPFTERFVAVTVNAQRRLRPGWFAGIQYTLRSSRITAAEPGGLLEAGTVPGSGTASGVSVLISRDTRDNIHYPSSGRFHRASVALFAPILGSEYRFLRYDLNLRWYRRVVASHVLAVQASFSVLGGTPPFRMLPGVGSVLRGYPSMRYIDKNCIALQAEYRAVPVWWRLGFVVFAGVGEVAPRLGAFSLSDPKYAVGVGLRFLLFSREKVTVRHDVGFGKDTTADYLYLNEAF